MLILHLGYLILSSAKSQNHSEEINLMWRIHKLEVSSHGSHLFPKQFPTVLVFDCFIPKFWFLIDDILFHVSLVKQNSGASRCHTACPTA